MSFPISPGITTNEVDLTTIVPAVSTSIGAIAGVFRWGPINQPVLVSSETQLKTFFGAPTSFNAETWFTASSFLGYSNSLYVTRVANTTSLTSSQGAVSAFANSTGAVASVVAQTILNNAYYQNTASFDANVQYVAKYAGALGNSLRISVCDSVSAFSSNVNLVQASNTTCNGTFSIAIGSNTASFAFNNDTNGNTYASTVASNFSIGDLVTVGNSSIGTQLLKVSNVGIVSGGAFAINFSAPYKLSTNYVANTTVNGGATAVNLARAWEFSSTIQTAPTTSYWTSSFGNSAAVDSLHVVVVDAGGLFSGTPNAILETFTNLSRATDALNQAGQSIYYKQVLNNSSQYVWFANDRVGAASNTSNVILSSTNNTAYNVYFNSGNDGYTESTIPLSNLATGYNYFADKSTYQISLILQGHPTGGTTTVNGQTINNFQLANYLIDNIAEVRKDCVVFITPDLGLINSNPGNEPTSLVNWFGSLHTSTYAFVDSGYKYMYDRYNDVYRYIPLNGDTAGLCARTDATNNTWWSPAGFNRGQIKNVVNLRWNPPEAARNILYPNAINPVVSFPGQGTILYGDRTATTKPSAFDRINVRRLFITLEKAISQAAQYSLFEFNDAFTQAQFRNLVIPYLSQVQAGRGITDFLVVCDGTNNTPAVVNANQFVGDIYIKPNRSINFIQLNFVAVASGVQFSTIVGSF